MTIVLAEDSNQQPVLTALERLVEISIHHPDIWSPLKRLSDVNASSPIGVYRVLSERDLPSMENGSLIPTSRRFFLQSGTDTASVDISGLLQPEPGKFERLSWGEYVTAAVNSIADAQRSLANLREQFELRILEIVPIYISAIWLHSNREQYFLVFKASSLLKAQRDRPLSTKQFRDLLNEAAELTRAANAR